MYLVHVCPQNLRISCVSIVGHGRSEGDRVHVEDVDTYVQDAIRHVELMKNKYPHLPCILMGHSMVTKMEHFHLKHVASSNKVHTCIYIYIYIYSTYQKANLRSYRCATGTLHCMPDMCTVPYICEHFEYIHCTCCSTCMPVHNGITCSQNVHIYMYVKYADYMYTLYVLHAS